MGTRTQPDPLNPWVQIEDLKRKLMQVRMALFTPEYLATHDGLTWADQTALIDAIGNLAEDARRMDWLDANCDELFVIRDVTAGVSHRLTFCAPETGCQVETSASSLRDAVDSARVD